MQKICKNCGAASKKLCKCKRPSVITLSGASRKIKIELVDRRVCDIPVEVINLPKAKASHIIAKYLDSFTERKLKSVIKYEKSLKRRKK